MDEATRAATQTDLNQVVNLLRAGRTGLDQVRGGALWLARHALPEPLEATIAATIQDETALVQLGLIDQVPVGVMVCGIEPLEDAPLATLVELFVAPDARGVGVGELMMEAVLSWAAARGCGGIDGFALPGDRATKNFFETHGLVARGIIVHRSLG